MKKNSTLTRVIAAFAIGSMILGGLTACGTSQNGSTTGSTEGSTATRSNVEATKLTVGATPTPHAEILEAAKPILKEKGIELEIVDFTDYVQPNLVLSAGDLDANFFQHLPYLEDFNTEQKTDLVSAGAIHYEPLGIYPGKSSDLVNIQDGAEIAVPNDPTNEARALLLLETNGIIKLKEDAGLKATVQDIVENPHNVKIVELEAAQVSRVVSEVDFVVLNGNYALQVNFNVETDSLAMEEKDSDAAKTYANVIAVKKGDEKREDIKILLEVLGSTELKQFIADKYEGSVVPAN